MSGELDPVQRIASPPINSGRLSPSPYRSRHRDDENLLRKDKGYRRYASTVERVLSQFDTSVEEWADYITFLGRLLKALSVKPSGFTEIPHKFLVAKRLSQCLNPNLPSGVHQKTLEVYSYVFSTLGKDGVAADLGLYLPGLSPVLSFAALSVKPNILTIFETYVIALKATALRPALKSILLALLPGLEEENSDEFDRTLKILNALRASIARDAAQSGPEDDISAASEQYFWQCMFLTSITSSTRRPGALAYLVRNLPQLGNAGPGSNVKNATNGTSNGHDARSRLEDAIEAVVSPEPGLLIRCFCSGLQDSRPLIQRGFLDLLVTHLPLNSVVLQEKVIPTDLERLVIAATSVVARKDMSLNRRLWSWFLGPEPGTDINGTHTESKDTEILSPSHNVIAHQSAHFEEYGLQPLVSGISSIIDTDSESPAERTKALRICLSLMDRWEIGGLVIPRIFLPAMRSVWLYQSVSSSTEFKNEVLRSANMFFDGVESSLIWSEICEIIVRALQVGAQQTTEAQDMFEMVLFMITSFNIREEEMQTIHMPFTVLMILAQLQHNLQEDTAAPTVGTKTLTAYALKVASRLLELVPSRALLGTNQPESGDQLVDNTTSTEDIISKVLDFYRNNKGNIDAGRPFSEEAMGQLILNTSFSLLTALIHRTSAVSFDELDNITAVIKISIKKGVAKRPNIDEFIETLLVELEDVQSHSTAVTIPFAITLAKVSAVEAILSTAQSTKWITPTVLRSALPSLIYEIWPSLSSSRPKHNVEAVKAIWTLYTLCQEHQLVDSTIVTLMIHGSDDSPETIVEEESARRFTTLWTHVQSISSSLVAKQTGSLRSKPTSEPLSKVASVETLLERPLMLLLDALNDAKSPLFSFVSGWLQSLASQASIIELLLRKISSLYPVMSVLQSASSSVDESTDGDPDGLHLCYYYLQMVHNVIQYANTSVWDALGSQCTVAGQLENISTHQDFLAELSIRLLQSRREFREIDQDIRFRLTQVSLALLRQFYAGPLATSIVVRSYDAALIIELCRSVQYGEHLLQTPLMEVVLASVRPRGGKSPATSMPKHKRTVSKDATIPASPIHVSTENTEKIPSAEPPSALLDCILLGLRSSNSRPALESWTTFLGQCLALYGEAIFKILLPLVGCFCDTLESLLEQVDVAYNDPEVQTTEILDPTITILLNGLEQSLATAHDILVTTEATAPPLKSPEPQQAGFFGSMVGAFAGDTAKPKTLTANNRLTVLLCFKDAMKICYSIWAWGDSSKNISDLDATALASYKWTSLRLRNRTRRIFEHLFAAEALECLETLIELWQQSTAAGDKAKAEIILSLLSVLESSRPKISMPAIFNAIYSRTNPSALEPSRTSTLTSNLTDTTLASFMVAYLRALDDDAMDEIWNDCIVFLKDLLANPMPHRQTLPSLIEFTAVLGEKVGNTTFGEQRKPRRELGDLFIRLVSATLTIRPMGTITEATNNEKQTDDVQGNAARDSRGKIGPDTLVAVLARITPSLGKVLLEADRVSSMSSTISSQVIAPVFRAKAFPDNIDQKTLELVQALLNLPEGSKFVKKDIYDAFNDTRFFSIPLKFITSSWLPILQSWSLADKERMPELLSRLGTPAAAGVLGIGANSARLDADRRTQLTLRRISLLILSAARDTYVINLAQLQDRLVDLLHATATSSPSSITRAEIYMVIRALVLKVSPVHLAPFWPTIHTELFEALATSYPASADHTDSPPNPLCLLQACRLLDTLLVLGIDDFQMQEWLFISDTTDAVYRPADYHSAALVDDLAQALDQNADAKPGNETTSITLTSTAASGSSTSSLRKPLLTSRAAKGVSRDEIVDRLVRPFFRQLSIFAFESTYGLQTGDWEACFQELVADLFEDGTLV